MVRAVNAVAAEHGAYYEGTRISRVRYAHDMLQVRSGFPAPWVPAPNVDGFYDGYGRQIVASTVQ